MKKGIATLIRFYLVVALVGCAGHGGGAADGGAGPAPAAPQPPPLPAPEKGWGELACQKATRCRDVALNVSPSEWEQFFTADFALPAKEPNDLSIDAKIYLCARRLQRSFGKRFPQYLAGAADDGLSDFFLALVEPESCIYKKNLQKNMTTYFKSTEEYKDETK